MVLFGLCPIIFDGSSHRFIGVVYFLQRGFVGLVFCAWPTCGFLSTVSYLAFILFLVFCLAANLSPCGAASATIQVFL